MSALRLAAVTLTAPDVRASERFFRWCLDLKPGEATGGNRRELSWGREDRILLVSPEDPRGEESLRIRMAARRLEEVAAWCSGVGIDPETLEVPPEDEAGAREAWPDRPIEIEGGESVANRIGLRVRPPGGLPVELEFPLPADVLAGRGRRGPFAMRSADWSGLEIPGLLGVRTGVTDPEALRAFAALLGARPLSEGPDEPLVIGDHQWILESRETPGIYGFAVVVSAGRLGAIQRTLGHMDVEHRLDGQRLLAVDPEGRVVLIHGLRQG